MNKKLPIDVLLNHLKNYKDAVVILGPDIANQGIAVTEESKSEFNRKNMVKNPSVFWSYYANNLMHIFSHKDMTTETVEQFLNMQLYKNIIDTDIIRIIDNKYNAINLTGKNDTLECVRCHKVYEAKPELKYQQNCLKCDCGGNIKPTVLCFGEKYDMNRYKQVKEAIFEETDKGPKLCTHTLILIGVDFSDSLVSEIIDSFDALKDRNHYTVIIADKEHREDVIYYNPEFGVCDDIQPAMKRLIDLLEK